MAMTRTLARLTVGPHETTDRAVRPRERPTHPLGPLALLVASSFLLAPQARAVEMGRDLPAGWAPFAPAGPEPLPPPSEGRQRPADLSLVWYDPSGSLPGGYEILAREVRSIFRGLGVEVSWRIGGLFGGGGGPEVPVILLPRDPAGRRRSDRILGLVVPEQEPQRAVWVFQESVRRVLGPRPDAPDTPIEPLARALGRVVAHEIVHAIAPHVPHARDGLMQHAFGRSFLLGTRPPVDASCAAAFVSGLAAEAQRAQGRAAARSLRP